MTCFIDIRAASIYFCFSSSWKPFETLMPCSVIEPRMRPGLGEHHWLDGHEFEQAPGVGNGQGSLACCSPWGRKCRTRLSDWTKLSEYSLSNCEEGVIVIRASPGLWYGQDLAHGYELNNYLLPLVCNSQGASSLEGAICQSAWHLVSAHWMAGWVNGLTDGWRGWEIYSRSHRSWQLTLGTKESIRAG